MEKFNKAKRDKKMAVFQEPECDKELNESALIKLNEDDCKTRELFNSSEVRENMREDTKTFTETQFIQLINEIKELEEQRAKILKNDKNKYNLDAMMGATALRVIAKELKEERFPNHVMHPEDFYG